MRWPKALQRLPHLPHVRLLSGYVSTLPIINIPNSTIYELGSQTPTLHSISLVVHPHESWAVVSADAAAGKAALFGALTGTHRLSPPAPPPGGLFPFLEDADPHRFVQMVRFAHRGKATGDGFYDFTARYGAVREGDRQTLRETFFPDIAKPLHPLAIPDLVENAESEPQTEADREAKERRQAWFEFLSGRLRLTNLLDLPMVALSNGQTRRARIAKAFLEDPRLLLLDEPFTGLDVQSRAILLALLEELKRKPGSPHVIMGLRAQDPLPDWTTHVALIEDGGKVHAGKKEEVYPNLFTPSAPLASSSATHKREDAYRERTKGDALIDITSVNVEYGPRKILSSINWTIRANSRWHLIGENGAGKTTLLALLTGEHPQSYTQSDNLRLFDRQRAEWATPFLHRRIGRVSPELFNAYPRRRGLTVWDTIGTGFDGGFVPKGQRGVGTGRDGEPLLAGGAEEEWRVSRMHEVMRNLGPSQWHAHPETLPDEEFFKQSFAELSPGEQSMVLLMRALVGAPPLVLLDEAWAGMDKAMVQAAHRYLRDGGGGLTEEQACVVVSHWEEEVPWGPEEGVERYKLDGGEGKQIFP
ncbi:P-loop containing nucleoside triphosphate hydrolase protein [Dichomitus squalens]|uniref:P-loop containing nucleoside triphosphate hydrolase protein n=1 Tax=Dichomitus squalens (strain LYAD-421) TaxID=732165 RepID=R7T0C5_DICSQ|nr:P-loop containing nucleoside triphosphate hydrolase protein [Dichomitus squalens LYAD-421 SS1]EJF60642.1 P-loop containing nucleoside triphosphate hydrolase protein [Dichomitus squalens LYAD-421 SS1]TBU46655.1 P-loop containing nucleoside triphosphate hydrolase protein [Dichomitus squalens]